MSNEEKLRMSDPFTAKGTYCCYCGIDIPYKSQLTREHLVPISKGGRNHSINILPCCKTCNTMKGGLFLEAFLEKVYRKYAYLNNTSVGQRNFVQKYDYEIMLENIKYLIDYVDGMGETLFLSISEYKKYLKVKLKHAPIPNTPLNTLFLTN